jgi:hypothetical protein
MSNSAGIPDDHATQLEPLPEVPGRSFSSYVSIAGGVPTRSAQELAKIGSVLTEADLTSLSVIGASRELLLKLASIDNDSQRREAIKLVLDGQDLDQFIAGVHADPGLSDDEWLDKHCAQIRSRLEDPSAFDQDALLYRSTVIDRASWCAKHRGASLAAKAANNRAPFGSLINRTFFAAHPSTWLLCHACKGKNKDNPSCECYGCGYTLSYAYPAPTKRR